MDTWNDLDSEYQQVKNQLKKIDHSELKDIHNEIDDHVAEYQTILTDSTTTTGLGFSALPPPQGKELSDLQTKIKI